MGLVIRPCAKTSFQCPLSSSFPTNPQIEAWICGLAIRDRELEHIAGDWEFAIRNSQLGCNGIVLSLELESGNL